MKKPTTFTLSIRNYRGLANVSWSPAGVCALVGPNGSGKTTLLEALDLLRDALASGLTRALETHGGLAAVRFFGALGGDEVEFALDLDRRRWSLRPAHVAGSGFRSWERFLLDGQGIITREKGDDEMVVQQAGGKKYPARDLLALACAINNDAVDQQAIMPVIELVRGFRAYGSYDIPSLRRSGSPVSSDRRLDGAGRNVFSVLRGWRDRKVDRHKVAFVLENLARAFPDFYDDVDFEEVAQIVTAQVRLKPFGKLVQLPLVPDGWFVGLLHLTAVASAEPGGVISIDEPENALHPFAIRKLVDAFREWSELHGVTVLLATHSPVILDTFKEQSNRIFVMEPGQGTLPVALDKLKTSNWLAHFALGDLYAHGEYGAPPEAGTPTEGRVA